MGLAKRASLVLAVLALTALHVSWAHKHEKDAQLNFDYFYLVRQWPATFCNEHACKNKPPNDFAFTIHGLWPQRKDGSWPEYCDPNHPLRESDIKELVPKLEASWPSWEGEDVWFWSHEWSRHGTCAAAAVGDSYHFFKNVLKLHKHLSVEDALEAADIAPSASTKYKVQAIKDAIQQEHGVMPQVMCDKQGRLTEVWMCISTDLEPIDCVAPPRNSNALTPGSIAVQNNCLEVTIPPTGDAAQLTAQDDDDDDGEDAEVIIDTADADDDGDDDDELEEDDEDDETASSHTSVSFTTTQPSLEQGMASVQAAVAGAQPSLQQALADVHAAVAGAQPSIDQAMADVQAAVAGAQPSLEQAMAGVQAAFSGGLSGFQGLLHGLTDQMANTGDAGLHDAQAAVASSVAGMQNLLGQLASSGVSSSASSGSGSDGSSSVQAAIAGLSGVLQQLADTSSADAKQAAKAVAAGAEHVHDAILDMVGQVTAAVDRVTSKEASKQAQHDSALAMDAAVAASEAAEHMEHMMEDMLEQLSGPGVQGSAAVQGSVAGARDAHAAMASSFAKFKEVFDKLQHDRQGAASVSSSSSSSSGMGGSVTVTASSSDGGVVHTSVSTLGTPWTVISKSDVMQTPPATAAAKGASTVVKQQEGGSGVAAQPQLAAQEASSSGQPMTVQETGTQTSSSFNEGLSGGAAGTAAASMIGVLAGVLLALTVGLVAKYRPGAYRRLAVESPRFQGARTAGGKLGDSEEESAALMGGKGAKGGKVDIIRAADFV